MKIEYPTTSKLIYKNKTPFIRIYKNEHVYYGIYDKDILLIELHVKPIQSTIILKKALLPTCEHFTIDSIYGRFDNVYFWKWTGIFCSCLPVTYTGGICRF